MTNKIQFIAFMETVLDELYDHHAHLNVNTSDSFRLVPSGLEVWAEWEEPRAVIHEVRPWSDLELQDLTGAEIIEVNGVPVKEAIMSRLPPAAPQSNQAVMSWALRSILAGRHSETPQILVSIPGGKRVAVLLQHTRRKSSGPLTSTRMGKCGYIRINNSLGDHKLIPAFDAALTDMKDTAAMILDLRDTPGGGNTTVARALMSRFVSKEMPYQKHSFPAEEREHQVRRSWVELVSPRGPFIYTKPVCVLVSHWTGSMGEGLAIGLDALERGTVVGTRMAGLLGATYGLTLPNSNLSLNIPAEKLFHVNGTPREEFIPKHILQRRGTNDAPLIKALELVAK